MNKKFSNEEFDKKLIGKDIVRVDDYITSDTRITFRCKKCDYEWKNTPNAITSKGRKCPKCSGNIITNDIFDKRISERFIKRLGSYVHSKSPIKFECLKCNYMWDTIPNIILMGSGCPKCANRLKSTNEDLDNKLVGKNVKRIGNYVNNSTKIEFQCLENNCNHIWPAKPNNILSGQRCPLCFGKQKLTNEIIDTRLVGRDIQRIENYINIDTNIEFKCLVNTCQNVWKATPDNVVNSGTGCPNCSFFKNEKIVQEYLIKSGIKFFRNFYIQKFDKRIKKRYKLDFYLPDYNLVIEYNGQQHYEPICFGGMELSKAIKNFKKQQKRDNFVINFLKNKNISLIEIDGRIYRGHKLKKFLTLLFEDNQFTGSVCFGGSKLIGSKLSSSF